MAENHENINSELAELSPLLARLTLPNPFLLPEGYFENFYANFLLKTNGLEGYSSVPEGYFESLPAHILKRIRETEALKEEITLPVLASGAEKENIFLVPKDYFTSLPSEILGRINAPATPIIHIQQKNFFVRYAAAAVVTGLLGLSLFSSFNQAEENVEDIKPLLAQAHTIIATKSFDVVFNSLDDEEIVNYLEAGGQDVQAALVAAASEKKELPEEFDYFSDENTLSDFIKELNLPAGNNSNQ